MRAYRQLVTTQLKITLRDPADLFFALIFGPMLVLALGVPGVGAVRRTRAG